jgi:hypothetical protein
VRDGERSVAETWSPRAVDAAAGPAAAPTCARDQRLHVIDANFNQIAMIRIV